MGRAKFWESNEWPPTTQVLCTSTLQVTSYNHSKGKNRLVHDALVDEKWVEDVRHDLTSTLIQEFFLVYQLIWNNDIILSEGVEDTII